MAPRSATTATGSSCFIPRPRFCKPAACRPRSRPDPETVCRPPAGITPTFLNPVDAIRHVCPRCKSIALFNQASVAPSFGGGFKNPRRGNGPIITLLAGRHLRETIWLNVLSQDTLRQHYPLATDPVAPTWIDPPAPSDHVSRRGDRVDPRPVLATAPRRTPAHGGGRALRSLSGRQPAPGPGV
ncbi:type I-E CRISPR-associated protein Cse1/CasA [Candidatus Falkowbacteria bacterium]|nr:type I-E CRISPR-associated protein Cse1/CasA [Candidatus Falkowbacteria bacterium]